MLFNIAVSIITTLVTCKIYDSVASYINKRNLLIVYPINYILNYTVWFRAVHWCCWWKGSIPLLS